MTHPNATVAATTGGPTLLIIWIVGQFGVDVPPEVAAAAATTVASLVLFIGRKKRSVC